MKKRQVSFLLCAMMMISTVFVGCGNKTTEEVTTLSTVPTVSGGTQSVSEDLNILPLSVEEAKITWATYDNFYAPSSLASGLEIWKQIEEKTNVKITWEATPSEQYDATMQVKLAAATNLPDIVLVPGLDPTPYGQAGLFIPIETLIEKYAPNIKQVFKDYPGAKQELTSGDGHIYGISPIVKASAEALPVVWTIRKDWLDKLKLTSPDSLSEWVTVLKAFRDKDPNANGKKDEIPFVGTPLRFSEAFGLQLCSGSDYYDVDGKAVYQWTDSKMVEFFKFANELYNEKLIDPNYGNPTTQSTQSRVTNNLVGAFALYPDWIDAWQKTLRSAAGGENAVHIPILPPKGANGERTVDTYTVIDGGFTSISKDCKDPVLAIKLMDYLWSEEGQRYLAWGIEGKTYTLEAGKPVLTDYVTKNTEGLGASDVLRTVGAWPTIPWVQQKEQYTQMLAQLPYFEDLTQMMKSVYKTPFPMLLATKEQQEKIGALENDITTYRKEMVIKFIIGKEPISNFNKYVETLKGMGLDDLVKIKQTEYDFYKSNK